MSVQIKSLKKGVLPTGSEGELYAVPANKTAIVQNIRLVNTGGAAVTVNLYVRRGHDAVGTLYRIAPKDLSLAPGTAYLDDQEVTLEYVDANNIDGIRGLASAATVDYVLSGLERDQS